MIRKRHLGTLALLGTTFAAWASGPQDLLKSYSEAAKKENPAFQGFSVKRGESLFRAQRIHSNGSKISCTTCHSSDPKAVGHTRAHKEIKPIAWSVNPERFTDREKVEKWFRRNCKDVLERPCTVQERGDFVAFMLTVK